MVSRALVGLAFVTAAKSGGLEDETLGQMRSNCPQMLRTISESGASDMQVAMECRAMFPPDVCRGKFADLGARPWKDEKIEATCGGMVTRIQADFDTLPRDLQDAAYTALQEKLNKCTKAKQWIGKNPPLDPKTKKPIKVKVPKVGTLDASFLIKVVLGMKMQDMQKAYMTRCKGPTCPPTTTPKPPPGWMGPQLKSIAVSLSKGENPTLMPAAKWAIMQGLIGGALKPKPPAKKPMLPPAKLFTDEEGPIPEAASRTGSAWVAMVTGGIAFLAVGAFAVQRTWRARAAPAPSAANPDDVETTLE